MSADLTSPHGSADGLPVVTDADWRQAHLINAAHDIHVDDPEFDYRLISDDLKDAGHVVR